MGIAHNQPSQNVVALLIVLTLISRFHGVKSIKVIIVGDIHFPEVKAPAGAADVKDDGFPKPIAEAIIPNRLANVVRRIVRLTEEDSTIKGLLICGDLTSKGDLEGYRECVAYLNRALGISDSARWPVSQVHVVPGNHDINRKLCSSGDIFAKFSPLIDAWKGPPERPLTAKGFRQTTIADTDAGVEIFSLNSCIGCGEKRFFPEKVREEIAKLITDDESTFDIWGEQLDTPAFLEDDVSELINAIALLPTTRFPIILGHHNILPQALVRVAIYTEAVNGGLVRSRLANCPRPILYCHGHIHSDPVEIVRFAGDREQPVIIMSVPELIKGFDLIEVHFGIKSIPLGLTVHRFRVRDDGSPTRQPELALRIPLRGASPDNVDNRIVEVLRKLDYGTYTRSGDLVARLASGRKRKMNQGLLSDLLLEAEWLGLVGILNRDQDLQTWQIQKFHP